MIIWGSNTKERTVGSGVFFCPSCRLDAAYDHIRVSSYFTLYFIPLFATSTLGEAVGCKSCGSQFNMEILRLSREQILESLQPWACGKCGNLNPRSESGCLACGAHRTAPPPLPPSSQPPALS